MFKYQYLEHEIKVIELKTKNIVLGLIIISTILFAGCVEKQIGGERDAHGCLGAAGYTWNESASACIRTWELTENQIKAAKIAVDHVGYEKNLTIIEVAVARCPGCFSVTLEKGKDRLKVQIDNWEVKEQSLTPDECIAQSGRTVNIVGDDTCEDNETNLGEVTGFISPNICCKKISNFQDCVDAGYPVMESYPRQCRTADDRAFTEGEVTCSAPTGESMSLFDAMLVCKDSECCSQVKEPYESFSHCNDNTGTWWIDLDIEKEGCFPECVVNIAEETAEINWLCTGLLG